MNISDFIDSNGLISPDGKPSGNGLLYTAEYIMAAPNPFNPPFYWLTPCRVVSGLFNRSPTNKDQEAFDDYVGLAACNEQLAKEILSYGRINRFVYNNVTPGKFTRKAWLGRSPAFVAHLYMASGFIPSFFLILSWCVAVALSSFTNPKNQDGWILSALMIRGNRAPTLLTRLATKIYIWRLLKHYPSVGHVMEEYFGHPHPVSEAWKSWPESVKT